MAGKGSLSAKRQKEKRPTTLQNNRKNSRTSSVWDSMLQLENLDRLIGETMNGAGNTLETSGARHSMIQLANLDKVIGNTAQSTREESTPLCLGVPDTSVLANDRPGPYSSGSRQKSWLGNCFAL